MGKRSRDQRRSLPVSFVIFRGTGNVVLSLEERTTLPMAPAPRRIATSPGAVDLRLKAGYDSDAEILGDLSPRACTQVAKGDGL